MSVTDIPGLEDLRDLIGSYNDLTERLTASQKALQSEVLELRRELAEKNRQLARKNRLAILGEMAAGVAHEVRNPLGGIELYAGLIRRESDEGVKTAKWARRIQEATADLSRIVGDMLDFTRPIKPRMRPVLLSSVADAALDMASAAVEKHSIRVERDYAGGEPRVAADANLLQRAFLNIILNAADAVGDGGLLKVAAHGCLLDGRPAGALAFSDSGPGIEPEALEKVFDPFFTRKENGTGLGLAMVARIVEAHSGQVTASNGPAGGAVFTVTMPAGGAD